MAVYTLPAWGVWEGGGGCVLEARVQFCLFKDLQGKICCTEMT